MFIILLLAYFTYRNVSKVHPCCSICQGCVPFHGWIIFHGVPRTPIGFIYFSVEVQVGYFTFWLWRIALLWTFICSFSVWTYVFISLGWMPGNGTVGSHGNTRCHSLRNCWTLFQCSCSFFFFHSPDKGLFLEPGAHTNYLTESSPQAAEEVDATFIPSSRWRNWSLARQIHWPRSPSLCPGFQSTGWPRTQPTRSWRDLGGWREKSGGRRDSNTEGTLPQACQVILESIYPGAWPAESKSPRGL